MPLTEAQQIFTDIGAEFQSLIDEFPGKIAAMVEEDRGDEMTESELAQVEAALRELRNEATAAISKQLEMSHANLFRKSEPT